MRKFLFLIFLTAAGTANAQQHFQRLLGWRRKPAARLRQIVRVNLMPPSHFRDDAVQLWRIDFGNQDL